MKEISNFIRTNDEFTSVDIVIVGGDFNNAHTDYDILNEKVIQTTYITRAIQTLYRTMNYMDLVQAIYLTNTYANVLDLLFVPIKCMFTVQECLPICMVAEDFHKPVKVILSFKSSP